MRDKQKLLIAALLIGIVNAVVFKVFEFLVNEGSDYIWNDLFNSDVHRWIVVPLAMALSICLSVVFLIFNKQRISKTPQLDSLAVDQKASTTSLGAIGIVATIGVASLVAGASLGPEASLMMISTGLGIWMASKTKLKKATELLILSSIGALLVAFCGSIIPLLMPLLLLWQKGRLSWSVSVPPILACSSAYATLWLMDHDIVGFGNIPVKSHLSFKEIVLAILVGIGASALGWLLKATVLWLAAFTRQLDKIYQWIEAAAIFGLVIGALYWLGGEPIQFSGSHGSALLLHQASEYSLLGLIGVLVAKLAVTAWSLAAGYQGGLVFPSIFLGVALALIVENIFGLASPGVLLGAVAGVFGALTGPAVALIFICSIIPLKLVGVAVAGILGSILGNKLINYFSPSALSGK